MVCCIYLNLRLVFSCIQHEARAEEAALETAQVPLGWGQRQHVLRAPRNNGGPSGSWADNQGRRWGWMSDQGHRHHREGQASGGADMQGRAGEPTSRRAGAGGGSAGGRASNRKEQEVSGTGTMGTGMGYTGMGRGWGRGRPLDSTVACLTTTCPCLAHCNGREERI